ncbi:MAG TPA: ABC transporter ATP-binding protein [Candidatus Cryosericum sp.]|nr:ABC transporter ATP-binding protein [Candidatus Cryosericum sp.]
MQALSALDLKVPRGTVFGLLGPNGAGKTTLVKLALGIAFPTGGRVTVLDRPAGDVETRARVGYLPENHRYPAHLTGEQTLYFFGRLSGLGDPELGRRVDLLLKRVKLEDWRGTPVRKYSKGMMQRLGMAQAILNEPDLLILDEPTDGVDPVGRREIRDLLLEQKERGATIFLNSHLLSEVERVCDRVAILKGGRLVREGQVEDLTRVSSAFELEAHGASRQRLLALAARFPGLAVAPPAPPAMGGAPAMAGAGAPGAAGPAADEPVVLTYPGGHADLNRLIDALRSEQVSITSVRPRRESLEEVFVRVVSDGEGA